MKKIVLMSFALSALLPCYGSAQDSLRQNILRASDVPRAAEALLAD